MAADMRKLILGYTSGFNYLKYCKTKQPKGGSEGTDQPVAA